MRLSTLLVLGVILLAVPTLGCLGLDDEDVQASNATPSEAEPAPEPVLPAEITGFEEVETLSTDGSGNGIWIDEARDLLLSSNGGGGLQIFDISEGDAERLGSVGDVSARDVDLLEVDGTPYAVLAASGDGIHVVDTSDPREPVLVATADEYGAHNLAAVPGTPYVYDSTGMPEAKAQGEAVVPVLDLSTPEDPSWTSFEIPAVVNGQPVQSDGCHDVWVREDLGMAYCAGGGSFYTAGGGESFIWDISEDASDPEWIGIVDNPSIMYHHQAVASADGEHLYINDEFLAPNCRNVQPVEAAPAAKQSTAAMWIYDISDPANPQLESYVQNPEDTPHANCGSHFGDLISDTGVVTWGWYQGGTMLVDVSDPANPAVLDEHAAIGSTWDAQYHAGHVYASSGDVQVLDLVGE